MDLWCLDMDSNYVAICPRSVPCHVADEVILPASLRDVEGYWSRGLWLGLLQNTLYRWSSTIRKNTYQNRTTYINNHDLYFVSHHLLIGFDWYWLVTNCLPGSSNSEQTFFRPWLALVNIWRELVTNCTALNRDYQTPWFGGIAKGVPVESSSNLQLYFDTDWLSLWLIKLILWVSHPMN